ncbi:head GIN domain-containing protein [Ulvibacter sp. MAR_2010_11]|uniref:head GIN domain-containing protein n=1 Tax=Ulvibacter sp. MAR_2010_11 TaxID=1250229 RepID=UPI001E5971CC|nr:head GIN domain-containing protein [Ulvibacter sp. MAR_2010_11]
MIVLTSCTSEFAWDCVQESGPIIEREFNVRQFKKIQVWERVQLIVSQGDFQSVRVETGENLMNEIQVVVKDSILTISDRNSCNWVREYGITKVYVTTPNITEIRNSSGLTVESRGILRFRRLKLISEDITAEGVYHTDGDFNLDLDVGNLNINANGLSKFYLRGKIYSGFFGLFDGDVRIEAAELEVERLYVFHRSTNKMIVNPQDIIRGEIRSLGNVISKNRPRVVEVEELYTGRLIFE